MRAPTRALIVEDIDSWVYILDRAARYAGASEVVACQELQDLDNALRNGRFDVALIDIGLDPHDQINDDGVGAIARIRAADGDHTRCVLVTGWQGGDRMDLQARVQKQYGVEWAYMKENYDARTVIAKLSELLDRPARPAPPAMALSQLRADVDPHRFEAELIAELAPAGGVQTLFTLTSRLLGQTLPLVPRPAGDPLTRRATGGVVGTYWSRALSAPVAVNLVPVEQAPDDRKGADHTPYLEALAGDLGLNAEPILLERVRERNLVGLLYELPQGSRDDYRG